MSQQQSYGLTGDIYDPAETEKERRQRLREEERKLRKLEGASGPAEHVSSKAVVTQSQFKKITASTAKTKRDEVYEAKRRKFLEAMAKASSEKQEEPQPVITVRPPAATPEEPSWVKAKIHAEDNISNREEPQNMGAQNSWESRNSQFRDQVDYEVKTKQEQQQSPPSFYQRNRTEEIDREKETKSIDPWRRQEVESPSRNYQRTGSEQSLNAERERDERRGITGGYTPSSAGDSGRPNTAQREMERKRQYAEELRRQIEMKQKDKQGKGGFDRKEKEHEEGLVFGSAGSFGRDNREEGGGWGAPSRATPPTSAGAVEKRAAQLTYQQELKQQMEDARRRKEEEKRQEIEKERRIEEESMARNPWGRGGGGAPVRKGGEMEGGARDWNERRDDMERMLPPDRGYMPPGADDGYRRDDREMNERRFESEPSRRADERDQFYQSPQRPQDRGQFERRDEGYGGYGGRRENEFEYDRRNERDGRGEYGGYRGSDGMDERDRRSAPGLQHGVGLGDLLGNIPSDEEKRKQIERQNAYQRELKQQMEENKRRKEEEKRKREMYEAEIDKAAPWLDSQWSEQQKGRGEGGRQEPLGYEGGSDRRADEGPFGREPPQQQQQQFSAQPVQQPSFQRISRITRMDEPDEGKKRQEEAYKAELQKQIEERRRKKEEEKRQKEEEDLREQQRLEREAEELKEKFEREQQAEREAKEKKEQEEEEKLTGKKPSGVIAGGGGAGTALDDGMGGDKRAKFLAIQQRQEEAFRALEKKQKEEEERKKKEKEERLRKLRGEGTDGAQEQPENAEANQQAGGDAAASASADPMLDELMRKRAERRALFKKEAEAVRGEGGEGGRREWGRKVGDGSGGDGEVIVVNQPEESWVQKRERMRSQTEKDDNSSKRHRFVVNEDGETEDDSSREDDRRRHRSGSHGRRRKSGYTKMDLEDTEGDSSSSSRGRRRKQHSRRDSKSDGRRGYSHNKEGSGRSTRKHSHRRSQNDRKHRHHSHGRSSHNRRSDSESSRSSNSSYYSDSSSGDSSYSSSYSSSSSLDSNKTAAAITKSRLMVVNNLLHHARWMDPYTFHSLLVSLGIVQPQQSPQIPQMPPLSGMDEGMRGVDGYNQLGAMMYPGAVIPPSNAGALLGLPISGAGGAGDGRRLGNDQTQTSVQDLLLQQKDDQLLELEKKIRVARRKNRDSELHQKHHHHRHHHRKHESDADDSKEENKSFIRRESSEWTRKERGGRLEDTTQPIIIDGSQKNGESGKFSQRGIVGGDQTKNSLERTNAETMKQQPLSTTGKLSSTNQSLHNTSKSTTTASLQPSNVPLNSTVSSNASTSSDADFDVPSLLSQTLTGQSTFVPRDPLLESTVRPSGDLVSASADLGLAIGSDHKFDKSLVSQSVFVKSPFLASTVTATSTNPSSLLAGSMARRTIAPTPTNPSLSAATSGASMQQRSQQQSAIDPSLLSALPGSRFSSQAPPNRVTSELHQALHSTNNSSSASLTASTTSLSQPLNAQSAFISPDHPQTVGGARTIVPPPPSANPLRAPPKGQLTGMPSTIPENANAPLAAPLAAPSAMPLSSSTLPASQLASSMPPPTFSATSTFQPPRITSPSLQPHPSHTLNSSSSAVLNAQAQSFINPSQSLQGSNIPAAASLQAANPFEGSATSAANPASLSSSITGGYQPTIGRPLSQSGTAELTGTQGRLSASRRRPASPSAQAAPLSATASRATPPTSARVGSPARPLSGRPPSPRPPSSGAIPPSPSLSSSGRIVPPLSSRKRTPTPPTSARESAPS